MNDTIKPINKRQVSILNIVELNWPINRKQIQGWLNNIELTSKPTLLRDIKYLINTKMIVSSGSGPATTYSPTNNNPLVKYFDIEKYFTVDPDKRVDTKKTFNFSVFNSIKNIFNKNEELTLKVNSKDFKKETKKLDPSILKKEFERFTIELAWKSSKIEGNTYSLLETESLIKEFREAKDKTREEKQMILNHKTAFETILANPSMFKKVTVSEINQLHNMLTKNLNIDPGIRKNAVGITGTVYKPLDNQFQIQEAMEKMVNSINDNPNKYEKAFIASSMIAYIQPYNDGNKRTSRMLTNAILLSHNLYPLSYRTIDENEYKKAVILFYEQNSLYHLKRIFIDQFIFATKNYFN